MVAGGDAEAGGSDLLDGAAAPVAVGVALVARLVLAALAGVGLAADAVHGNGEGFVGLPADGAERHGAGLEPLDDFGGRLDFLDGDRVGAFQAEAEEAAQGA